MAAITCPSCGSILKTKDPVPPGKKVKCPKCATVFEAPAEESAAPAEAPASPQNDFAGLGAGAEEEKPKKKGKSAAPKTDAAANGDDAENGKSKKVAKAGDGNKKTFMIVGIVAGVLLLCCCIPSCVGIILNWTGAIASNVAKDAILRDAKKDLILKDDPFKDAFKDSRKK